MDNKLKEKLEKLAKALRYDVLISTSAAESGHLTSCLSAVELMTVLFFAGFFHQDVNNFENIFNDRIIFSKGHSAPLLYALYHRAGILTEKQLLTLRQFNSPLQGHPVPEKNLGFIEAATGSLGQGLSIGLGMALALKLKLNQHQNNNNQLSQLKIKLPYIFVLLGDSEMAEGQNFEAMNLASYYKTGNLVAIVDVNRLGQRGETIAGWNLDFYQKKFEAFGWQTLIINDGHNFEEIYQTFQKLKKTNNQLPIAIIAKTIKGKGISFLENQDNWHGKSIPKELLNKALNELGEVDLEIKGEIKSPKNQNLISDSTTESKRKEDMLRQTQPEIAPPNMTKNYQCEINYSTRESYGDALVELGKENQKIVVLDGETGNSTFAEKFKKVFPERYFEMFIAEQNMISVAVGFSRFGFVPFVSTFAAFLTRGFDQIRMAQYSWVNLKICGSHAGVSIGPDGPSQMGLEDLSMFKSILSSVVFYPSDAISTKKLVKIAFKVKGIFYLRTTREKSPVIYQEDETFEIGGSKVHFSQQKGKTNKRLMIITAGITLFEALSAQKELEKEAIDTLVIDAYSIKPIDEKVIKKLIKNYPNIIVVEDHYPYGGLKESVLDVIKNEKIRSFYHLAVFKTPRSGKKEELFSFEEIDKKAIIKLAKKIFHLTSGF